MCAVYTYVDYFGLVWGGCVCVLYTVGLYTSGNSSKIDPLEKVFFSSEYIDLWFSPYGE